MADQITKVLLTLDAGPESDAEDLEQLTRHLREELLELDDADEVDLVREGEIPEKAKAGDPITWGTLMLAFVSGGGLTALIGLLKPWIERQGQGSVTLDIEGDAVTVPRHPTKQQQEVIDVWLRRHRGY